MVSCVRKPTYAVGACLLVRSEDETGFVTEQRARVVDRRWLWSAALGRAEYYEFIWGSGQRYGLTLRELEYNGARVVQEN